MMCKTALSLKPERIFLGPDRNSSGVYIRFLWLFPSKRRLVNCPSAEKVIGSSTNNPWIPPRTVAWFGTLSSRILHGLSLRVCPVPLVLPRASSGLYQLHHAWLSLVFPGGRFLHSSPMCSKLCPYTNSLVNALKQVSVIITSAYVDREHCGCSLFVGATSGDQSFWCRTTTIFHAPEHVGWCHQLVTASSRVYQSC